VLHLMLKDRLEHHFAQALAAPIEMRQDALLLHLDNGVAMELRYAALDAYAIAWRFGDVELRIDTAPLHPELGTHPNHLHDADGRVREDRLTDPSREPWDNVRAVIEAVRARPLLGPA
jgi:hypothetical protein